ncbi:MAG: Pvc16 family protein [Allosphingosinicella sp.]
MSVDALFNTTMALRRRILDAGNPNRVYVGAPVPSEVGDAEVSLTLFDINPSAALRNTPRYAPPPSKGPVTGPAAPIESIALELRFLIACYRQGGIGDAAAFPDELARLGRIIASLHADPILSIAAEPAPGTGPDEQAAALAEQIVRLSLESYGLDDLSRLGSIFGESPLRTCVVYLATPVYVTAGESRVYPRVRSRRLADGLLAEPDPA